MQISLPIYHDLGNEFVVLNVSEDLINRAVFDNGGQWTHKEWKVLKKLGVDSEIVDNDINFEEIKDSDGWVLSGDYERGELVCNKCGIVYDVILDF